MRSTLHQPSRQVGHPVSSEALDSCNSAAPEARTIAQACLRIFPRPLRLPSILSWMSASINSLPTRGIRDDGNRQNFTRSALPILSRTPPTPSKTTPMHIDLSLQSHSPSSSALLNPGHRPGGVADRM
ncbi:hypothetical protein NMY22_g2450 [Coprinellus aureogranulatus]|nr:hypothetical protein NMY22_g2450 [Coprinellus aureogranulatus]